MRKSLLMRQAIKKQPLHLYVYIILDSNDNVPKGVSIFIYIL